MTWELWNDRKETKMLKIKVSARKAKVNSGVWKLERNCELKSPRKAERCAGRREGRMRVKI